VPDPSPDDLDALLELQATDHRLRKVRHLLDDLPEQQRHDAAVARAEDLGREHDDVRLDLDRATAEQRQLERETEILAQRRDAETVRLYDGSVTNQREARSVEAEIESTKRRISEHEDRLLEVLETVETLESRVAELARAREATLREAEELAEARDLAAKELLAEQAELQVLRDRQAAALPDDLLDRYEQVAARAGGTGVGRLEGNACTACRIELSYADVGELLAGPPLASCPQCRRLLVVPA
jgi:predicted  nucleic acid-binding Zn-ribbon protein